MNIVLPCDMLRKWKVKFSKDTKSICIQLSKNDFAVPFYKSSESENKFRRLFLKKNLLYPGYLWKIQFHCIRYIFSDQTPGTAVETLTAVDPDKDAELRFYLEAKNAITPGGQFVDQNIYDFTVSHWNVLRKAHWNVLR